MPRKAKQTTSSSREDRRLLEDYDQAESGEHRNHYTVDDDLLIPDTDERKIAVHRRRGIYRWLAVVIFAAGLVLFMSNWHRSSALPKHQEPMKFPGLPPPTNIPRNDAFLIRAETGAVASEEITCSEMGVGILKAGGTAVDAAISTTLCIGVINSFSSGIGGGGFMLVRIPSVNGSNVTAIDFRETSPSGSFRDMYTEVNHGAAAAQVGGLSIGVPGELRGLEAAHRLYGNLTWERVVKPAADMAAGFRVGRELARRLRIFGAYMLDDAAWSAVFAPQGSLLVEGDWIRRTNLSRTLNTIATKGADAFYNGEIADSIIATVRAKGGIMTHEDLENYKAYVSPAIQGQYYDKKVFTTAAPSSGGVLLGLLQILEHYNIGRSAFTNLQAHRFVEALKMAFGARSEVSDPAFASNVARHSEIYSTAWVQSRIAKITDNCTHSPDYYDLIYDTPTDHGTTHLVVVDHDGGVASVTSTVNMIFGSRVMDATTGVILNDEQDDFSIPGVPNAMGLAPSPYNYPTPGKRPLSSTAPVIIEKADGSFHAALGGSGGSRIFGAVAQVLVHLERGMNVSAAVEAPRLHDQIFPQNVSLETGFDRSLVKELQDKGHTVVEFDINLGIAEVQAITRDTNGTLWAASDSRKNGVASGY